MQSQPVVVAEVEWAVGRWRFLSGQWWNMGCEDVKVKSGHRLNKKREDVKEK